jgi:hypothetical protein
MNIIIDRISVASTYWNKQAFLSAMHYTYWCPVTLCSNGQTTARRCCPVVTVGHVTRAWLLLAPHSSDETSDIGEPFLLEPTITTDPPTSEDRCYWVARDTCMIATSPHDIPSDISDPLLLTPTVVIDTLTLEDHCYCGGTTQLLLAPTIAMSHLTSVVRCY